MTTRRIGVALLALAAAGLPSCKGSGLTGGAPEVEVSHSKVPATKLAVKSAHTFATTKTFSAPDGKGGFSHNAAASITVYLSNQPLDPSRGMLSMGEVPGSKEHLKAQFTLVGKDGTAGKEIDAAPEVGTYGAKADRFMKVESAGILAHDGTQGAKHWLDRDKLDGQVEIKKVSDGKIEGTVDLRDGAGAIKGTFVATLGKGAAK